MLENVTTSLPDVQKHLIDLLPADAILLGHSLEYDLRALKVGPSNVQCVVPENVHAHSMEGCWKFLGEF